MAYSLCQPARTEPDQIHYCVLLWNEQKYWNTEERNSLISITLTFSLSWGGKNHCFPWKRLICLLSVCVVPFVPRSLQRKLGLLSGPRCSTPPTQHYCTKHGSVFPSFKGSPWNQGCCLPFSISAPRNFLTVGGCVSGSLLTALLSIQGSLCSTEVVGGCAKMASELKWNSQILPPTCRSLIKPSILFCLAICLLHVSNDCQALCDLLWLTDHVGEHGSCSVFYADTAENKFSPAWWWTHFVAFYKLLSSPFFSPKGICYEILMLNITK